MATQNLPPQEYESDGDSYEVLDLTEYARRHHWWNRVFGHSSGPMVEKYSVATQIVMGGVSVDYTNHITEKSLKVQLFWD